MAAKVARKCLNPTCNNLAFCRGLCQADYQAAWKLVEAGQVTWDRLIAEGLAMPAGRRGLGYRNSFRELILERSVQAQSKAV